MKQYQVGDRINGEYLVSDVFGGENKSGMGVVYLVKDRERPEPFVLKTFQKPSSRVAKRQFLSEARSWVNAGAHPNLVKAFWVREIAEQIFVAAEFIARDDVGRNSVTDWLGAGPIGLGLVLNWAAQFAYGMEYAKSNGILVHRDIKPDNILVDKHATLKITDFGLAKSIDGPHQPAARTWWPFGKKKTPTSRSDTRTGSAMGTLPYMAPEQFSDAKRVDHRADLYSFGIILYQMVTQNGYPYKIDAGSENAAEAFYRAHLSQRPLNADNALMPVISRCLQKYPSDRFGSYKEFLTEIQEIAGQHSITISKPVFTSNVAEELYAKAQSYIALGDSEKALRLIDEYVEKFGENACGWTEKGGIHFKRGEYKEGLAATKESLKIGPYNSHAWNNLAVFLNKTDAPFAEVRQAYLNGLTLDPGNHYALANIVSPLVMEGEFAEASYFISNALQLTPDKPLVLKKAEALLRKVMEKKDFEAAEVLLKGWTAGRPQDVDAWHNLGLVYLQRRAREDSVRCFEKVHDLVPHDQFALVQLAKLTYENKQAKECLNYCNKLLARGHDQMLAVSLKARILNLIGGYERAIKFIQPYLQNNPTNDALWVVLAEIHEYRENETAALSALQTAKKILDGQGDAADEENVLFVQKKIESIGGERI